MLTRRELLGKGMGAAALGVLAKCGLAATRGPMVPPPILGSENPLLASRPFLTVPSDVEIEMVEGFPFANWWTGDSFDNVSIPFHQCENCFKGGLPPVPTEEVDVVVVGGGISGLSVAYMLRPHRPVLFELRDRFGGNAQGERWGGTFYSLGNAYVITPDSGSFLERLYLRLGLDRHVRLHDDPDEVELKGKILDQFWGGLTKEDRDGFLRYSEVVTTMADRSYPEIPLIEGKDNQWILDLDQKTLKEDIEEQMGIPVPPLLAAAVQAYCYSSFAAGWEEISAASGWNFLAAEEYGKLVFPGGCAQMADAFWRALARMEKLFGSPSDPQFVRGGTTVVDVRFAKNDRVQVTYATADGKFHSLLAKKVVMACSKHVAKYLIHDLDNIDPDKATAMDAVHYNGYVVVNLLLDQPIERDFYDVFLLGDGNFPMSSVEFQADSRVVDMLNGHYARVQDVPTSVLTLYWPLPFPTSRFTLITPESWRNYAEALAPQLDVMLNALGLNRTAVRQVRMSRWGHAMPIAEPNLIANGTVDHLRRPMDDKIFFVNQDNWALPAVENCLLDAEIFLPQIKKGL